MKKLLITVEGHSEVIILKEAFWLFGSNCFSFLNWIQWMKWHPNRAGIWSWSSDSILHLYHSSLQRNDAFLSCCRHTPCVSAENSSSSNSEISLTSRASPPFHYLLYRPPVFWQCGAVCLKEIVSLQRKWRGAGVSGAKLTAEHVVLRYDPALTHRWWKTKKLTLRQ